MKSKYLFHFLLIPLFSFYSATNDPLEIGDLLPKTTVKMKDISGKELRFTEVKTKAGLLVMFSCNTCPYVACYFGRP